MAGCRVALTSSWFYSQAVARFVCCQPIRLDGPWLSMLPPVKVELLQVEDILAGRLHRPHGGLGYDVLLVPGGSAKADLLALRPEGCAQVRRFVQSGAGERFGRFREVFVDFGEILVVFRGFRRVFEGF